MIFKKEVIQQILDDDYPEGYKEIERSSWEQEGKYQHSQIIFEFENKFYRVFNSRSGSYHSDWYYEDLYDDVEADEVAKVEKITFEWKKA